MVPLRLDVAPAEIPAASPQAGDLAFLNHLRFVAMSCRAKARADLFEACALLQTDKTASQAAHAEALMRCLNQALGRQARLHPPGTGELSFDEAWLLQLGRAVALADGASARFLLTSRVKPEHRRLVRFLIGRISECFSLT
ncbi:MAG: hypothetical protein AAGE76_11565 [Pseudomonadota bacterium]